MSKIFISGLLNVETSLKVNNFPVEYNPIEYPFFGVSLMVSGVGYNIAKALKTLDDDIFLFSVIGNDTCGDLIKNTLKGDNIDISNIRCDISETPMSVNLFDHTGRRKIYCDLKDIQDYKAYDVDSVASDPKSFNLAVLTNINFSRDFIRVFKENNVLIASDVHVLSSVDDEYNKDFLENADILFLSNEAIYDHEAEFMKEIYQRYNNKIIVCGCGDKGALMYIGIEDKYYYEPAVAPKGVNSTLGAGDALFSSFIHFYNKGERVDKCLKLAVLFAGLKISSQGGSSGFVSEKELLDINK